MSGLSASLVRVDATFELLTHQLDGDECRVAFVEVVHGRLDTEGPQHPRPSDAQGGVLREADLAVALVEA